MYSVKYVCIRTTKSYKCFNYNSLFHSYTCYKCSKYNNNRFPQIGLHGEYLINAKVKMPPCACLLSSSVAEGNFMISP